MFRRYRASSTFMLECSWFIPLYKRSPAMGCIFFVQEGGQKLVQVAAKAMQKAAGETQEISSAAVIKSLTAQRQIRQNNYIPPLSPSSCPFRMLRNQL